jgi:hypothetical protein
VITPPSANSKNIFGAQYGLPFTLTQLDDLPTQ